MTIPVLPIFPEGSLAESVITTVWIGVIVLGLGNLRFGWTLSGLVTPGYLVPLMISKPISAAIILLEAVLTYALVFFFSRVLSRFGKWSNFFGRDRFFALVLCSILVRVILDGYILPYVGRYIMDNWQVQVDFAHSLHSFGLIIVSLIANQFWKPGLFRGLLPFFATLGTTYFIVRFPLMYFTNFSIGNLEYMYEDIAASILASPKSYVILVTTAYIASRMNLCYAWDFNGILIPALLALQWYEPFKVLTSLVEAWLIYLCGSLVLRSPWLKETTVEGARKIMLFFTISYIYKLLIGHGVSWLAPATQPSDFYGFGYLLPSLIAMKMHDKNILVRLTRTTVQASVVGALLASLLGFGLTLLPACWLWNSSRTSGLAVAQGEVPRKILIECLQETKISLYKQKVVAASPVPLQSELDAFGRGLRDLESSLEEGEPSKWKEAREFLALANYRLVELEDGLWSVEEEGPQRGWGTYVLNARAGTRMLIEVPAPLDEWSTMETGAYLLKLFRARALALCTSYSGTRGGGALMGHGTFFEAFHKAFDSGDVLQVRGYTAGAVRSLFGVRADAGSASIENLPTSLWVKSQLPAGLRLNVLKGLLKELKLEWHETPFKNILREETTSGFAELFLSRVDRKRFLARLVLGIEPSAADAAALRSQDLEKSASLQQWLLDLKADMAPRGSNLFVQPTLEALLYLDEDVLKPLSALIEEHPDLEAKAAEGAMELQTIHAACIAFNYELRRHKDKQSGAEYLLLKERRSAGPRRYWGDYVFRVGRRRPIVVEIPHPVFEANTLEYGVWLFEKLRASALLIAGSHPKCNVDGTSDVIPTENKRTLFNLTNQVLLREMKEEPCLVLQVRALGPKPGALLPAADALLAFSDASVTRGTLSLLAGEVASALDEEGLGWRFVDGSLSTGGYEAQGSAQAQYLSQTKNKEFAALWLSPFVRIGYRQYSENSIQESQFAALGIETIQEGLLDRLKADLKPGKHERDEALLDLLQRYRTTQDINVLYAIKAKWGDYGLKRVVDASSRKPFLLIYTDSGLLPLVSCLSFSAGTASREVKLISGLDPEGVRDYVESGAAFLWITE